jgi:hypothetical protein
MNDQIGTHQAGRLLGLSHGYIMRLARTGKIVAHKQDGVWFLSRLSVLEYKERQEQQRRLPKPLITGAAEVVENRETHRQDSASPHDSD